MKGGKRVLYWFENGGGGGEKKKKVDKKVIKVEDRHYDYAWVG